MCSGCDNVCKDFSGVNRFKKSEASHHILLRRYCLVPSCGTIFIFWSQVVLVSLKNGSTVYEKLIPLCRAQFPSVLSYPPAPRVACTCCHIPKHYLALSWMNGPYWEVPQLCKIPNIHFIFDHHNKKWLEGTCPCGICHFVLVTLHSIGRLFFLQLSANRWCLIWWLWSIGILYR